MYSFKEDGTLRGFQKFIADVYGQTDDRLYSIWDLLVQEQRFAMRSLKGIRKGDTDKIKINLLITFSWLMAISNRLHIDIEDEVWNRFPGLCSYCGEKPCACRKIKPSERLKIKPDKSKKPRNLESLQDMFENIYPSKSRTLADAGVHFAEEVGEVSEAVHNYLGQHISSQFDEIKLEMADLVSCSFGIANSAKIDVAKELAAMFHDNCHVCHNAPCDCSFSNVISVKS
jgi:NTP pyrophosphatase (non-canonical NTP hydrolase)